MTKTTTPTDISYEQQVLDSIRRIVQAIRISSRTTETQLGVSAAQLFVLEKLKLHAPLSVNELARQTLTDQSSVSVVVSRLVERGYVSRTPSSEDRRRSELSLTEAGHQLLASAPEPIQNRLIASMRRLPPDELAQLARLMITVIEHAGLAENPAVMLFESDVGGEGKPSR